MCIRTIVAVVLSLVLAQAASANLHFFAELSGANVAPVPVVTTGGGFATADHDSSLNKIGVSIYFSGLSSNVTGAKIHCCGDELNSVAGVAVDMVPLGFPTGVTAGNFIFNIPMLNQNTYHPAFLAESGGNIDTAHYRLAGSMDRVLDIEENGYAYFSIETELYPNGELRGNIAPAPEPSTFALLAGGLASLLALRRSRRA